jgi:hypothetical protein
MPSLEREWWKSKQSELGEKLLDDELLGQGDERQRQNHQNHHLLYENAVGNKEKERNIQG